MNNFMNALAKVMFKVGEFGFQTLWFIWLIACTIVCLGAIPPAVLMDVIGNNRHPNEKQFGVVGVAYVYSTCLIAPLRIVGYDKMKLNIPGFEIKTFDQWYQIICEEYKNGL